MKVFYSLIVVLMLLGSTACNNDDSSYEEPISQEYDNEPKPPQE